MLQVQLYFPSISNLCSYFTCHLLFDSANSQWARRLRCFHYHLAMMAESLCGRNTIKIQGKGQNSKLCVSTILWLPTHQEMYQSLVSANLPKKYICSSFFWSSPYPLDYLAFNPFPLKCILLKNVWRRKEMYLEKVWFWTDWLDLNTTNLPLVIVPVFPFSWAKKSNKQVRRMVVEIIKS